MAILSVSGSLIFIAHGSHVYVVDCLHEFSPCFYFDALAPVISIDSQPETLAVATQSTFKVFTYNFAKRTSEWKLAFCVEISEFTRAEIEIVKIAAENVFIISTSSAILVIKNTTLLTAYPTERPVKILELSPDKKLFASIENDGQVKIWFISLDNQQLSYIKLTHHRPAHSVSWKSPSILSPKTNVLVTMCDDGIYRFWSQYFYDSKMEFYLQNVIDVYEWTFQSDETPNSSFLHGLGLHQCMESFKLVPGYAVDRMEKQTSAFNELLQYQQWIYFKIRSDNSIIFWGIADDPLSASSVAHSPKILAIRILNNAVSKEFASNFILQSYFASPISHGHARAPHIHSLTEKLLITINRHNIIRIFSMDILHFHPASATSPELIHRASIFPILNDIKDITCHAGSPYYLSFAENHWCLWKHAFTIKDRENPEFVNIITNTAEGLCSVSWLSSTELIFALKFESRIEFMRLIHDNEVISIGSYTSDTNFLNSVLWSNEHDMFKIFSSQPLYIIEFQYQNDCINIAGSKSFSKEEPLTVGNFSSGHLLLLYSDRITVSNEDEELCVIKHETPSQYKWKISIASDGYFCIYTKDKSECVAFYHDEILQTLDLIDSFSQLDPIVSAKWNPHSNIPVLAMCHYNHISFYGIVTETSGQQRFNVLCEAHPALCGMSLTGITWDLYSNLTYTYGSFIKSIDSFSCVSSLPVKKSFTSFMALIADMTQMPDYHPFNLVHNLLWGNFNRVSVILLHLSRFLKATNNSSIDGVPGALNELIIKQKSDAIQQNTVSALFDEPQDDKNESFSFKNSEFLSEKLLQVSLPGLKGTDQMHLLSIVDAFSHIQADRRALDESAIRFMISLKQSIYSARTHLSTGTSELVYRDFVWAFQSESQDLLVDQINKSFGNNLLWGKASFCGMGLWIKSPESFKRQMEIIARNQFTLNDDRDPIKCAVLYLAMRKKKLWEGLWKTAHGHPEQSTICKFVANDFTQEKWKNAAAKNAYALLGKQRFELAAAFFLLGGYMMDAVNVCIRQLNDIQLGLTICRLYDGENSANFAQVVKNYLLKPALESMDRWGCIMSFLLLNNQELALNASYQDFERIRIISKHLFETTLEFKTTLMKNKDFNESLFGVFHRHLFVKMKRENRLKHYETDSAFWLKIVSFYEKRGCFLLAMDVLDFFEADFLNTDIVKSGSLSGFYMAELNSARPTLSEQPHEKLHTAASLFDDDYDIATKFVEQANGNDYPTNVDYLETSTLKKLKPRLLKPFVMYILHSISAVQSNTGNFMSSQDFWTFEEELKLGIETALEKLDIPMDTFLKRVALEAINQCNVNAIEYLIEKFKAEIPFCRLLERLSLSLLRRISLETNSNVALLENHSFKLLRAVNFAASSAKYELKLTFVIIVISCMLTSLRKENFDRYISLFHILPKLRLIILDNTHLDVSQLALDILNEPVLNTNPDTIDEFEMQHHCLEARFVQKLFKIATVESFLIFIDNLLLCFKAIHTTVGIIQNTLYVSLSEELHKFCQDWDAEYEHESPPTYRDKMTNLLPSHDARKCWKYLFDESLLLPEANHRLEVLSRDPVDKSIAVAVIDCAVDHKESGLSKVMKKLHLSKQHKSSSSIISI